MTTNIRIGLLLFSILATAALTGIVYRYARSRSLIDIPNQRSSHSVPTPRGGGIALAGTFLACSVILAVLAGLPMPMVITVVGGGVLIAGVGYWDDHSALPASLRLVCHFAAAILAMVALHGLPPVSLGSRMLEWGVAGYVIGTFAIVWSVNLYNFMDGIDGIAGTELVTVAVGASILLAWRGKPEAAAWLQLLAGGGLGFLVWNWPPAKIFAGDTGSGFIGFVLAVFVVWTGGEGGIGLWAWFILLGVFVVDATWTLCRRLIRRDKASEAHRTHAYQHAARHFGAHRPVVLAVGIINVLWLLPIAAFAAMRPDWGWWLWLVAWFPLGVLAWRFRAGAPEVTVP